MSTGIQVRFFGVRGSIATASARTAQVGGNTSCVEVWAGNTLFILDAGTGLRALGESLMARRAAAAPGSPGAAIEAHLLLSHFHWDHIQGFPFFTPAYLPGSRIHVIAPGFVSAESEAGAAPDVRAAFEAQMKPPHFPVGLDAMRADLTFRAAAPGEVFQIGTATVRTAAAHHPNGCLAFRIDCDGRSLVISATSRSGRHRCRDWLVRGSYWLSGCSCRW